MRDGGSGQDNGSQAGFGEPSARDHEKLAKRFAELEKEVLKQARLLTAAVTADFRFVPSPPGGQGDGAVLDRTGGVGRQGCSSPPR